MEVNDAIETPLGSGTVSEIQMSETPSRGVAVVEVANGEETSTVYVEVES